MSRSQINLIKLEFYIFVKVLSYTPQKYATNDLGCFANDNPYDNSFGALPDSPDKMQLKLTLYTRSNPSMGIPLSYNDTNGIARSTFDPAKPVKFVIHGYMSDGNEDWVLNISTLYLKKVNFTKHKSMGSRFNINLFK